MRCTRGSSRSSDASWGHLSATAYLLSSGLSFKVPASCRAPAPPVKHRWLRTSCPLTSFASPPPSLPRLRPLPLPSEEARFVSAAPPVTARSALVVSLHLDGLLRIRAPGMLQPDPALGFVAFPCSTQRSEELCSHFPATHTPLDEVPSPAAGLHHCSLFPSCRSRAACTLPPTLHRCQYEPGGALPRRLRLQDLAPPASP